MALQQYLKFGCRGRSRQKVSIKQRAAWPTGTHFIDLIFDWLNKFISVIFVFTIVNFKKHMKVDVIKIEIELETDKTNQNISHSVSEYKY